jgi:LCP family protein required for cell wall assembly
VSDAVESRHRGRASRKHGVLYVLLGMSIAVIMVVGLTTAYTYRKVRDNLTVVDFEKQLKDRPKEIPTTGDPLDILIMGSDSRDGAGNDIDGLTGGGQRSDTTILLHLAADREHAYGISIPRDSMVQRPECYKEDGTPIPASDGLAMFNESFAVGGPACTIQTVEQLTDIRIEHSIVVDFQGFQGMVDALDGVEVCVPEEVNDEEHNIHLAAGTQTIRGKEALNYVRERTVLSNNGDIGRMRRQQAFIASMASKLVQAETLTRPDRMIKFLDAATKSLTVSKSLENVNKIAKVGQQFRNIGLGNVKFLTIPSGLWPEDPNRLIWTEDAEKVWEKIREDKPLGKKLTTESLNARKPGSSDKNKPSGSPSKNPSKDPSKSPSTSPDEAELREANGLCA